MRRWNRTRVLLISVHHVPIQLASCSSDFMKFLVYGARCHQFTSANYVRPLMISNFSSRSSLFRVGYRPIIMFGFWNLVSFLVVVVCSFNRKKTVVKPQLVYKES